MKDLHLVGNKAIGKQLRLLRGQGNTLLAPADDSCCAERVSAAEKPPTRAARPRRVAAGAAAVAENNPPVFLPGVSPVCPSATETAATSPSTARALLTLSASHTAPSSFPPPTPLPSLAPSLSATAAADTKERYLQLLLTSLVLLRDAVETQDTRYTLRMLRRFKQLRLQQQQCPVELLQVCSLLFWKQQQLVQQLQEREASGNCKARSSTSSGNSYAHLSHLPPNTLAFWQKLQEALELIVKERQSKEADMETDGVPQQQKRCLEGEETAEETDAAAGGGCSKALQAFRAASFLCCLPEAEVLLSTLVLLLLLDHRPQQQQQQQQQWEQAWQFSCILIERVQQHDRRSLDRLAAKAWFFHSRSLELSGQACDCRAEYLAAYRTASARRDIMTQATLLNLLLRLFVSNKQYDVALKLVQKTGFPEGLQSNAQHARYLYYLGQIQAARLEYGAAFSHLQLALRKAPQQSAVARGFRLAALKKCIVVELLMGDIPERSLFNKQNMHAELVPYRDIVLAVRSGDLHAFAAVLQQHEQRFRLDDTYTLLRRLHQNVIRAGLRIISLSYSRIYFKDIALKLGLDSPQEAEAVSAKAILDRVIDATINHDKQFLESKASVDLYASNEPQKAFHRRITFCLDLYNDAVKAMQYPGSSERQQTAEDDERKRAMQEERARAEDDDLGDDMDMI
ncbi:probable 26S proteasome non-ATPase regulatory subunit 3 [Cyclospora cayetanensis]|uniref:Probable 26S proteasome non-ATPase regulatory subunit 3 n=1 Tax=Cyclospora cayetanensis TaxID=88456 RepID=A0A6P6S0H6_9EIME|nr:probable 26S proteasome non-ATPase regulatory subunit 3 [Cyclospora cayetanensis]